MPSESLPWDRKEVFAKDRKQDRGVGADGIGGGGGAGGGVCSTSRWREPYHGARDCPRASPRRPSTGHSRYDAGYQRLYPEESSRQGCTPSRSSDRLCPEEEIFKPSLGKSSGSRCSTSGGRESQGSSRRSPCFDSSGDCTRQHHFSPVTAPRSVVVPITHTSSTSSSPIPSKNLFDKSDGGDIDGSGAGQRHDRDHYVGSIAWKPLKWSRPSSFSLSKAVRPDSEEASLDISLPLLKESPVNSPVISNLPSDDRAPSKKPRLGWGQGLAKYEKQKVEGATDVSGQNGCFQAINCCQDFLLDSTPKFFAAPGSISPVTPTSGTCCSSPACPDEKLSLKVSNAETDRTQCSESCAIPLLITPETISINLDRLDANSLSALDLLLSDLMQPEETCSGDSSFTRHSALNKLLLLKKDISKELEKTECEIDLFENRLKSINYDLQADNYQEFTCMPQEAGASQPIVKSVNETKSLLKLPSSEECMLASSAGLEGQQVVHTHLLEEHVVEVKDRSYKSSGTIMCDNVPLDCSERENIYLSNLQTDICAGNKDENTKMLDVEPFINKNAVDSSIALIMASNKDAAKRASQEFDLAMPPGNSQFNFWKSDNISECRKNYMQIRGKLAIKKRTLKFKEHFLALKFRALHHLWREDLNLLALRKNRPKSNKRSEVNGRLPQVTSQKHRSSARSRQALPGNLIVVPTTEIINFTSKLLTDSQLRPYRNNLKMPSQIIDESDRRYSRFNSNNGLIEDPSALEKERMMMNPWIQEEKNIFLEMLATFGKDFKKISSFIPLKTTADCVEYYYKNHKSDTFAEVKRQLKLRKQWQSRHSNTYLMTSGTRLNREANSTSLELLGSASIIAAESHCTRRTNQKQTGKVSRRINGLFEKVNHEISGSEKEAVAADVLAGICGALSSDAMSSCITGSIDLPEKLHFPTIDRSLTPEAAPQTIDEEETCSDESSDEMESADWTDEEKSMFIRAFNMYGKDFVKVAHFVRTRSRDQCKIFFSKARKCLGLDVIQPGSTNGVTPTSDANEGRSGTDDACSTQSCSKADVDFTQSMLKTCSEGHANTGNSEIDRSVSEEDEEGKLDYKSSLLNEVFKGGDDVHAVSEKTNTNNERTGNIFSPGKPVVELDGDDKLKLQISAEVSLKASEVDSDQFIMQVDPEIENRPQVKTEECDTIGDSSFFGPHSRSNGSYCNVVEQKNDGCPNHVSSSNFDHQMRLDLLCTSPKGSHIKMAKPETTVSNGSNCVLTVSPSISFNKTDDAKSSIAILSSQDGGGMHMLSLNNNSLNRKIFDEKSAVEIPTVINGTARSSCSLDPCTKAEDQSQRVGDLKLFGQILTHPSLQNSNSTQEGTKNATMNSSTAWKDAAIRTPVLGSYNTVSNYRSQLPHRSYGFWDGNRIQTGLSSLPESVTTLAKYQVSAGVPIHTNIKPEYQQQTQIQSACTEKFLDTFPTELQKRNGFDVLSGFPQQRRIVHLGVNMVGSTGVSDPVAALQMHYSGRRAKILTGDLESLMGDPVGR